MTTFRNTSNRNKPDSTVKFFITEFIICAVLLAVCFVLNKLMPDTFEYLRQSYTELTRNSFTLPEIGNILSQAAQDVMEYLGVVQNNA